MSECTITKQDKFLVTVNLVPFLQSTEEPKICLTKEVGDKYIVPNQQVLTGQNCYEVANELIYSSCTLDRTAPFAARLVSCITGVDFLALIFRLDVPETTTFNEEFLFLNSQESSEAYLNDGYYQHYGEIVKASVENG